MKNLIVILNAVMLLLLCACATQKGAYYADDVYANPKEDREREALLAIQKQQNSDAEAKRYADSLARIQKQKDDANPYYKDREFKYDDYYDYEYATRVKRFNNSINGLGYYDNYYTNSYWYNHNPYNYGTSVYNGYSWWGNSYNLYSYNPSQNFYNNWGWNMGVGTGFNGYNPYMYNNGGYMSNNWGYTNWNPYSYNNGWGYNNWYNNGWGYNGYNNGYNNWNNNGWGYYNAYDNNSKYTYGARSSYGGGNSGRTSNPGMSTNGGSYYESYLKVVNEQQNNAIKFADIAPASIKKAAVRSTQDEQKQANPNYTDYQNTDPNRATPARTRSRSTDGINVTTPSTTTPVIENNGQGIRHNKYGQATNPSGEQQQPPVRNAAPVRQHFDNSNTIEPTQNPQPTPSPSPRSNYQAQPSNGAVNRPRN